MQGKAPLLPKTFFNAYTGKKDGKKQGEICGNDD